MGDEFLDGASDLLEYFDGPVVDDNTDDADHTTDVDTIVDDNVALDEPEVDPAKSTEVVAPDLEVEQPDVDDRDSLIEQLRQQVLELSKGSSGEVWPAQQKPDAVTNTTDPTASATQQQKSSDIESLLKEVSYLSEEEIDSIIDDPQLINKALNRARQDMLGVIQGSLPTIVSNLIEQQLMIQRVVQSFYEANDDLRPYADFVRYKMSQVEAANPNTPYGEIFTKTAEACRKVLGLKNPEVKKRDESTGEKPAFTASKRTSTQRPAPKKDDLFDPNAKDLLDLIT